MICTQGPSAPETKATHMATMPNGMTTGGGEVQELEGDSDLLCEIYDTLAKHDVPEGLRETIMDMLARWEMDK